MTLTNLLTEQAAASLAHKIVLAEQVKANEPQAAKLAGCSMFELMQRAGQACFNLVSTKWPSTQKLLIVAGSGNNAGDGYILASLAKQHQLDVLVVCQEPLRQLSGDAKQAQQKWQKVGGETVEFDAVDFAQFDLIVDALLGTGLKGLVNPTIQRVIRTINQVKVPVLSIDLPSGMLANSGRASPVCVKATCTITFIAKKPGLVTGVGKEFCQALIYDDLGVGQEFFSLNTKKIQLVKWSLLQHLEPRPLHSNKGSFGKLLCIGGNEGMAGAIRLTADSALRCGVGLVKAFCHPSSSVLVSSGRPEIMLSSKDLNNELNWCNCIVIGPGLGQDDWAHQTISRLLDYLDSHPKPLIIDADGLNLLATMIDQPRCQKVLANLPALVLTPHPKEASRLLNNNLQDIENDRYSASENIAKQYQTVCILKGAGTIIQSMKPAKEPITWVCAGGNPGMATAGMGDLLSGIIGAFLCQGLDAEKAAVYAVCAHAEAADRLALQYGERGMISSDLLQPLRALVNGL